jgi:hypothetical protein
MSLLQDEIAWIESIVRLRESELGNRVIRVNGNQRLAPNLDSATVITLLTPDSSDCYLSFLVGHPSPSTLRSLILTLPSSNSQPASLYLWKLFASNLPPSPFICIVCPSSGQPLSHLLQNLPTPHPANLSFYPADTSSELALKAAGVRRLLKPIEFASFQLDMVC